MQVYGIDLAKEKFDVNFINKKGNETNKEVKNKVSSISKFLSGLPEDVILCAEHTGVYGDLLVYMCNQMNIPIALVMGCSVKHSLGLRKGKSDPVDASRIREYGERFSDKLTVSQYDCEELVELKSLYTLRNQLVKQRKGLLTISKGQGHLPMQSISVNKHMKSIVSALTKEIDDIEEEMEQIIKGQVDMNESFELITSIVGIGPVITTELIIKTGNFKRLDTARKAASYAGICPFPNSSGKMQGKSKVSPFGDKKLKTLLYMGAKTAVKHNKEYRLYYQKKELEGKPHFLIMNNVSNKLLRTVYSIINSKVKYSRDHICLDPRERINNRSAKNVA